MQLIRPPMEFQRKSDPNRSLKDKSSSSSDQQDLNFDDDNLDLDDDPPVPDDDLRSRRRFSTASKRAGPTAGGAAPPSCQAERCPTALSEAKRYHRRHKVCEFHAKAPVAIVAGLRQRFCQQCSRFHELSEFDEAKRSCRRRLAGHNERRRKASTSEGPGEGRKQGSPPPGDQPRRTHQASNSTSTSAAASYKHFQMR